MENIELAIYILSTAFTILIVDVIIYYYKKNKKRSKDKNKDDFISFL